MYNLIERSAERELLPIARALDIGVTVWSPLGGGVLSGKYNKENTKEQKRFSVLRVPEFVSVLQTVSEKERLRILSFWICLMTANVFHIELRYWFTAIFKFFIFFLLKIVTIAIITAFA
jgi:hypothetical protein